MPIYSIHSLPNPVGGKTLYISPIPLSEIIIGLPAEAAIVHNDETNTWSVSFSVDLTNDELNNWDSNNDPVPVQNVITFTSTPVGNDFKLHIHNTVGDTTFEFNEIMSASNKERLYAIFNNEEGDDMEEAGEGLGVPIANITADDNKLILSTDPANPGNIALGYNITFVPGTAISVEGQPLRWRLPPVGKYNEIRLEKIVATEEDAHGDDDVIYSLSFYINANFMYAENVTKRLKNALTAILNAPAAVGGYRRRHRKTKRRQPKKKRTRKARK